MSLDGEQHEEISRLANAIDEQEGGDVSNFLSDAETPEVKEAVNEIWQMDRRKMKEASLEIRVKIVSCATSGVISYY